jgi:divalent metal cation (Fe/Co/Zn/Cd) transporter
VAAMMAVFSIVINEVVIQAQIRNVQSQKNGRHYFIKKHWQALFASVIVLIGIIGSMIGEVIDSAPLLYFDPIAALLVSGIVAWKIIDMITSSLFRSEQGEESKHVYNEQTQLMATVQRVYGVITVEELTIQEQGTMLDVKVAITVDPRTSIQEAYEIAGRAKALLLKRFTCIRDIDMRALPYGPGYPYKSNYARSPEDGHTLLQ